MHVESHAIEHYAFRARYWVAVACLVLNDHVWKVRYPGVVTGKLSDIAGLFFFPVFLAGCLAWLAARCGCALPARSRTMFVLCVVVALVFALTKTTLVGHECYRVALGLLQWPFRAARSFMAGDVAPHVMRVRATRDPSDLLALPVLLLTYTFERKPSPPIRGLTTCVQSAPNGEKV